jgi:hypothetical protein
VPRSFENVFASPVFVFSLFFIDIVNNSETTCELRREDVPGAGEKELEGERERERERENATVLRARNIILCARTRPEKNPTRAAAAAAVTAVRRKHKSSWISWRSFDAGEKRHVLPYCLPIRIRLYASGRFRFLCTRANTGTRDILTGILSKVFRSVFFFSTIFLVLFSTRARVPVQVLRIHVITINFFSDSLLTQRTSSDGYAHDNITRCNDYV